MFTQPSSKFRTTDELLTRGRSCRTQCVCCWLGTCRQNRIKEVGVKTIFHSYMLLMLASANVNQIILYMASCAASTVMHCSLMDYFVCPWVYIHTVRTTSRTKTTCSIKVKVTEFIMSVTYVNLPNFIELRSTEVASHAHEVHRFRNLACLLFVSIFNARTQVTLVERY
jgi:hypothetical protein